MAHQVQDGCLLTRCFKLFHMQKFELGDGLILIFNEIHLWDLI